jgi:hypothetical protein
MVISARERYSSNGSNKKGRLCVHITLVRRERDRMDQLTARDEDFFPVGSADLTVTLMKDFYLLGYDLQQTTQAYNLECVTLQRLPCLCFDSR